MPGLPLRPGTLLQRDTSGHARYEITDEVGLGGFGITYLARHTGFGTEVVIKELACDAVAARDTQGGFLMPLARREAQFDGLRRRFLDESKILHELKLRRARHVVPVEDVFEDFGTVYCVMPRVRAKAHIATRKGMLRPS